MRKHGLAVLFAATALMHLLPIWRVQYVPTVDGPSHLYNAVVMREIAESPELARVFRIDARPVPNWLSHTLLWLALAVAPPLVAEKIVLSIVVLLFLAALWRAGGAYAFIAMPFAFNLLLQMGSYNFMLATALMLFAVDAWFREQKPLAVGALLLLGYFAHPVPTAVAMLLIAIGTLVLRRRIVPVVAAFTPAALLLAWFAAQPSAQAGTWSWNGALMVQPLAKAALLLTLDVRQLTFGTILGVVYAILIVVTFAIEPLPRINARRERDLFLLFTVITIALYFAAPIGEGGDLLLKARFLLFPYLVVLPWLAPRLARWPLAIVFALIATANVFFIRDGWKRNDRLIARAIAPLRAAAPNRTFIAIVGDPHSPHAFVRVLTHHASYAAVERRLVDLGNYEAGTGYFPIAFRKGISRPEVFALESKPHEIDPRPYGADYVYTWKMQRDLEGYAILSSEGDARLWQRLR
jgi:hypothetical protein